MFRTKRHLPWAVLLAWGVLGAAGDPAPATMAGKVVILPVSDEDQYMVDEGLSLFMERRVREAEEAGAKALVLEIDTFGGAVHSALKISDLLMNTRIPLTVAFVKTKAISAGALIALSCREVVMNPNTAIGDCAPILQTADGIEEGPEKFKTPLRARFRLFAERHGYPAAIGEGMVDKEIVVYRIGEGPAARFITDTEFENLKSQGTPPVATVVKPKGQLLTLTAQEAVEYRVARALAQDRGSLLALYGWSAGDVVDIQPNWSEDLARWVTSPMVAGLLLLVGLVSIYIAMNHPGLGVPELLAILCFGLLFGGKYLAGLAESWEIALFALGVALLLLEFFVIPGFGFAGIAGAILILASLFLAFLPELPATAPEPPPAAPASPAPIPSPAVDWGGLLKETTLVVFGGFFGATLAILAIIKWMGSIPVLNRMVLTAAVTGNAAETDAAPTEALAGLLGKRGMSVTTLRPAGRVDIGGTLHEVTTEGDYVDRGQPVVVHKVDGNRVIVRKA